MSKEKHGIEKTELTKYEATLTLENGVTVSICSNDGYIHVGLSRINPCTITCTSHSTLGQTPKHELDCANSVNVFYSVRE